MFADTASGIGYFIRGLQLITKPGVKRYVLIPLLINMVLFSALIYYGYAQFSELLNWLAPAEDSWLSWLRYILIPLFIIVALVLVFFSFALIANIIGAPFNGLLATAVEKHLTGNTPENSLSWKQTMARIIPIILAEVKKTLYYLLIITPFLILFIIPVVNFLAPFAWLLVTAWILAVQYTDYPLDNHNIKFADVRSRLGQRRFVAFGFGGSVMFAMAIPIINFIVMPVAVAGATAMAVERLALSKD